MKYKFLMVATIVASIMSISLLLTLSSGIAFADPLHCDRPGYPSCGSVGYSDGVRDASHVSEQFKFIPACPSGHSTNFCAGYAEGFGDELNDRFG